MLQKDPRLIQKPAKDVCDAFKRKNAGFVLLELEERLMDPSKTATDDRNHVLGQAQYGEKRQLPSIDCNSYFTERVVVFVTDIKSTKYLRDLNNNAAVI